MKISVRQIAGGVVCLWVVALCYDMLVTPLDAWVNGEPVDLGRNREMLLVVGILLLTASLLVLVNCTRSLFYYISRNWANTWVIALGVFLVVVSALRAKPTSAGYALLLTSTFILTLYINHVAGAILYKLISIIITVAIFTLVAIYGFPSGRWIGGVHPNTVGVFALASTYFAARSGARHRYILYITALIFAGMVSSRFAVVSIFLICIFDAFTLLKLTPTRVIGLSILAGGTIILAIEMSEFILNDVMDLNSQERGFGSGISGRSDLNAAFWPQFFESPLFGYGFRSREDYSSTHSGYYNFLLENGLAGAVLLAAVAGTSIISALQRFFSTGGAIYLQRLGFWSAWLFAGALSPQLINFGDAFALFSLFLLTDNEVRPARLITA